MNPVIDSNELLIKAQLVKEAGAVLGQVTTKQKNNFLLLLADKLNDQSDQLIAVNARDMKKAKSSGMSEALLDRLLLTKSRIQAMCAGLIKVASLPDPIGEQIECWQRPNGLIICKTRVPLGAVGIVYEARPNVTVDAACLCLKAGNAVYLRGSSSALESNCAIVAVIQDTLRAAGLPKHAVMLLEDTSHETAERFFHLNGYLDVLIPRGSKRLIQTVVEKASVPVLETGAGNCHLYIDASAKPEMAIAIALNSKTQRPSVCNAIETIIVHKDWLAQRGSQLIQALVKAGVECRIDPAAAALFPNLPVATADDWSTEYLDNIVAVKVVANIDEAISHINYFGTRHSESIISETADNVAQFFKCVDASTVYHNASTRFTDGEAFGFGAEIGISTQKLHARGPMGLKALTTIKYLVEGNGQTRE
ncbi:MAG: glutamate-5-semialdehyde dehydrogenase [Sporolactobacillus sp.]